MLLNIIIVGSCQENVTAQEEMVSGRASLLMVLKGGVKDRGETPAKSSMVRELSLN